MEVAQDGADAWSDFKQSLNRYEASVADLHRELLLARHRIRALERSRSWRITAPLRSLRPLVRRVPWLHRLARRVVGPVAEPPLDAFDPPLLPHLPALPESPVAHRTPPGQPAADASDGHSPAARLLVLRARTRLGAGPVDAHPH